MQAVGKLSKIAGEWWTSSDQLKIAPLRSPHSDRPTQTVATRALPSRIRSNPMAIPWRSHPASHLRLPSPPPISTVVPFLLPSPPHALHLMACCSSPFVSRLPPPDPTSHLSTPAPSAPSSRPPLPPDCLAIPPHRHTATPRHPSTPLATARHPSSSHRSLGLCLDVFEGGGAGAEGRAAVSPRTNSALGLYWCHEGGNQQFRPQPIDTKPDGGRAGLTRRAGFRPARFCSADGEHCMLRREPNGRAGGEGGEEGVGGGMHVPSGRRSESDPDSPLGSNCEEWARIGECGLNPAYMLLHCGAACNLAHLAVAAAPCAEHCAGSCCGFRS